MTLAIDPNGKAWPRTAPGDPDWEGPWHATHWDCLVCGFTNTVVHPCYLTELPCDDCGQEVEITTHAPRTDR